MKKMEQKKVSKRKYVNLKLDENEGETRKDIHVPDNTEVLCLLLLHIFTRALVYCFAYNSKIKMYLLM